jgi:hypothetical protein
MTTSDVGRGRPPKHSRFKPGVSGNPKGRPKRTPIALGKIASNVLGTLVEYRENGRSRKATRGELTIKAFVENALKGSLSAAEMLLTLRSRSPVADVIQTIDLDNWLPDYPGQTGAERSRQHADDEIRRAKSDKQATLSFRGV